MLLCSCAQQVDPTADNINKIFNSKDFTFEFHPIDGTTKSLSFRVDYLVYQSDQPTVRREVSYEEVVLINDYIQRLVNLHSDSFTTENHSYYIIKNTAYKTTIIPDQEDYYFWALLKTLKLE
ncbi:MAG: hypothetical protein CL613_04170 [Aquimarina sp.]|nr:hypothetical protein [Aquimarina sp.]